MVFHKQMAAFQRHNIGWSLRVARPTGHSGQTPVCSRFNVPGAKQRVPFHASCPKKHAPTLLCSSATMPPFACCAGELGPGACLSVSVDGPGFRIVSDWSWGVCVVGKASCVPRRCDILGTHTLVTPHTVCPEPDPTPGLTPSNKTVPLLDERLQLIRGNPRTHRHVWLTSCTLQSNNPKTSTKASAGTENSISAATNGGGLASCPSLVQQRPLSRGEHPKNVHGRGKPWSIELSRPFPCANTFSWISGSLDLWISGSYFEFVRPKGKRGQCASVKGHVNWHSA